MKLEYVIIGLVLIVVTLSIMAVVLLRNQIIKRATVQHARIDTYIVKPEKIIIERSQYGYCLHYMINEDRRISIDSSHLDDHVAGAGVVDWCMDRFSKNELKEIHSWLKDYQNKLKHDDTPPALIKFMALLELNIEPRIK